MLNNTYDASGYRYGIFATNSSEVQRIISENSENESAVYWMAIFERMGNSNKLIIIDFEDIDGLTIEELRTFEMVNNDVLFFVMYDRTNINDGIKGHSNEFKIRNIFCCKMNKYPESMPIDDMIVEELFKNEKELTNKRTKCFLQRYKCGTKEETDKMILQKKKEINQ